MFVCNWPIGPFFEGDNVAYQYLWYTIEYSCRFRFTIQNYNSLMTECNQSLWIVPGTYTEED